MKKYKLRSTATQGGLTKNENYKRWICIIDDIKCRIQEKAPPMHSEVSKSITHGDDI